MAVNEEPAAKRVAAAARWGEADIELAMQVARRYYFDNKSKVDIGKEFELTRFQIGRILQEARLSGVVKIEIGVPGREDPELGERLARALGIERAIVIEASRDSYMTAVSQIGAVLARVVSETVLEGDILGLTWSRTTDAMSRKLTMLRPCTVVQLAGHLHTPGQNSGSVELVRRAAAVSGGESYPIYAPMLVQDAATADALRSLPEIESALEMADKVDIAVASVGAWRQSTSQLFDALPPELIREASDLGAVGEVAGRIFAADGSPVPSTVNDRVIAVSLEQLRNVPHVVLSGFGDYRMTATLAAVAATDARTLVTDASLATAALAHLDS